MTEVVPFHDDDSHRRPSETGIPTSGKSHVGLVGGLLYLVGSLCLSAVYLTELNPSVSNDYWWSDFNTTGLQTFLGDMYNAQLSQGRVGPLPLFDGTAYSTKSYADASGSRIEWSASYARTLLLDNIPLEHAVRSLRLGSITSNILMGSFYCWVDLDRKFALSMTPKRQARCEASKTTNAAVYFEPLVRNGPANDILTSSYSGMLNATMLQTLGRTADGKQWVDAILAHKRVALDDEVAYWRRHGLEYWRTGMQNLNHDGIDDSIQIQNALGYKQTVRIKKSSTYGRGLGKWTTLFGYCGFWNVMDISQSIGASVILTDPDSVFNMGIEWDVDVLDLPPTPGVRLVRQHIGPFLSLDMMLVSKPPTLSSVLRTFQTKLGEHLKTRAIPPAAVLDVVPATWIAAGREFYGGSPVCPLGSPQPFIQESFGYYADCTAQARHTVEVTLEATLFALQLLPPLSTDMAASICNLCPTTSGECLEMLRQVSVGEVDALATSSMSSAKASSLAAAAAINIQFMQMASQNGSEVLLLQPLVPVHPSADPWTFFGLVMIYDWLQDGREVYNFEGDQGNLTLISQSNPPFSMVANPGELPQNACNYIRILTIYVSFNLIGVGTIVMVYAAWSRCHFRGANLLKFNRVVGSVWVGRPMLFLRGMTALIVLSTSPVEFVAVGRVASLYMNPRSIFSSGLFAGEAAWVTYVVQDVFLPVIGPRDVLVAVGSIATWVVLFVIDVVSPLQAVAAIQPTCSIGRLGLQIVCESGIVEIGSMARLVVLVGIAAGIPLVTLALSKLRSMCRARTDRTAAERTLHLEGNQVVIPAAAVTFLSVGAKPDAVALVMAGMLPIRDWVFDIKLWRWFHLDPVESDHFDDPTDNDERKLASFHATNKSMLGRASRYGVALAGFGYMVATVFASYSYLALTEYTMANDFWWEDFNSTGHQSFVTAWFNRHLQSFQTLADTHVHEYGNGDTEAYYGGNMTQMSIDSQYASVLQDEVNSLHAVVAGLRNMDTCLLPWIASSYCYVDFGKSWEMAVSVNRQQRCKQDTTNGAVYLESVLRNAKWTDLDACWGTALNIAVFDHVRTTPGGRQWLEQIRANAVSVAEEVDVWRSHGIAEFTTQWQNYKKMGVVESAAIQNAFGLAYAITIKKQEKAFQLPLPTSFRLQWPLANLLDAVAANSSGIGGMSLVRSSPRYGLQNVTIEQLLIQNGTISSPWGQGLAVSRETLGPFGTTTLKRLTPPRELKTLLYQLRSAIMHVIGTNMSALAEYASLGVVGSWYPSPLPWKQLRKVGGSLMCENTGDVGSQIALGFMADGTCGTQTIDQVYATKVMTTLAVAAMGPQTPASLATTCMSESTNYVKCTAVLPATYKFLVNAVPEDKRRELADLAVSTRRAMLSRFSPQLIQLTQNRSVTPRRTYLESLSLLDADSFEFFGWLFMFGWVSAHRELVVFQGDTSTKPPIAIMSGEALPAFYLSNPQEIPLNVAFYIRRAMQYITLVLLGVAVCVCFSIVANRGYVEGLNMFEFNRVAGIVWIGRPLILLRGITAICILSTSRLELRRPGNLVYTNLFTVAPDVVTTFLSSGEMGWFVYILNDLFSVITSDYTTQYAWKASTTTWLVAAVWSLVAPVSHVVRIDRQCTLTAVDFAMTCQSGTFEIGRFDRFVGLLILAVVCCVFWYVVDRCRAATKRHAGTSRYSLLLHASAQHQFDRRHWELHHVYYLDQASAVLNGIIAFRTSRGKFAMMDIKTWRVFRVDRSKQTIALPPALTNAIPLVE
ncbi:hypothetical protein DYB32_006850 [Aphanomyces invadans]|uniref:Uncharacterized protein n=1 Tax=Aphanomyces invadans TaxID=157072 RepID=A0A3R6ZMF4_9STRA|nr:hypothetical protein DYB32_006850 [Aphanomyces invadans]